MSEVNDISKAKVVYGTHAGMHEDHSRRSAKTCVCVTAKFNFSTLLMEYIVEVRELTADVILCVHSMFHNYKCASWWR